LLQARKTTRKESQNSHSIRQKKDYQKSELFSSGRRKTPEEGSWKSETPCSDHQTTCYKKSHFIESEKNLVLRVLFVTRIIKSELFLGKKVPS
jgi:hypothetical protein